MAGWRGGGVKLRVIEYMDLGIVLFVMNLVCVQDEIGNHLSVPHVRPASVNIVSSETTRWDTRKFRRRDIPQLKVVSVVGHVSVTVVRSGKPYFSTLVQNGNRPV